jgi:hypothetical protein
LLFTPYPLERGFFAETQKVVGFVEQDRRPLGIVNRDMLLTSELSASV